MKEHELDYIERLKNEITNLTGQLARYEMRSEILAKRVQRNLLEAIERTPKNEKIDLNVLMKYTPSLTASDVVDIFGVILIEAKQKADEHNNRIEKGAKNE